MQLFITPPKAVPRKPRDGIKDMKVMVGSGKRMAKSVFPVTSDHGRLKNAVYGQTAPGES
jgi:hypothetical protein